MDIQDMRRKNLRQWVKENGVPPSEKSYFSQLLGGSSFGERSARRLEADYGMPPSYLDSPIQEAGEALTLRQNVAHYGNRIEDAEGQVSISLFNVQASMGVGALAPDNEAIIGKMVLSEQWLRSSVSFSNLQSLGVISAIGDSMSPTFAGGDILLVDRGISEIRLDAVYVLSLNDELYIKRVQRRLDGAYVIKSDNPLYDPQIVENGHRQQLRVLGRVLWAWNGRKL